MTPFDRTPRLVRRRALAGWLLGPGLALLLALAGCGDGEKTYTIEEVREGSQPPAVPASADSDARFGMRGHGQRAPQASEPSAPREWAYAAPEGWELLPPKPMRDLGWKVAGHDDTECTFTVLPGTGGGLAANVNRWRAQMGLPPQSEAEIQALPKAPFLGTEARVVDLKGKYGGMRGEADIQDARMLGLILDLPRAAVFLKMTGPAEVVTLEEGNFQSLAASLRPKPAAPAEMPPGHGARPSRLTWKAPEGWTQLPDRPMREVTFTPAGGGDAETYVSLLAGDAGGLDANINRWREQMGQKGLSPAEIQALPRLEALGRQGVLVTIDGGSFTGMSGEKVGDAAMLGFIVIRDSDSVFVKMTGPADVVLREKENFEAFCRSLAQ